MPLVYLDSCIFIAAFEAVGREATRAKRFLERLQHTRGAVVTSELTMAELLAPSSRSDVMSVKDRQDMYLPLMLEADQFIDFIPVSREIVLHTPKLRAGHQHRLPDAIHIATAVSCGCRFSSHPTGMRGVFRPAWRGRP